MNSLWEHPWAPQLTRELRDSGGSQRLGGQCHHVIGRHCDDVDLVAFLGLQDLDAGLALVHGLHVRAQVVHTVEAAPTLVTQERLLPWEEDRERGVGQGAMPRGRGGFWEVPTSVDDDVLGQVAHVDEGFVADGAFVGPDVVVVADVVGQLARLDEPSGMTPSSP